MAPMTAIQAGQPGPGEASRGVSGAAAGRVPVLRFHLASPMPADGWWGWGGPLLVTLFGGWLRFSRLSVPEAISFDETYYVKDAWSMLHHGVEWNILKTVNNTNIDTPIAHGYTHIFAACSGAGCGEFVVMPPVGKWLIAIGEWLFGLNSLGWRYSAALFGSLAILLLCRIVRRMTRSTMLGCVAGFLLSLDGLEFVLSRTGILDIFLMFFVLAAFGCMVIDRDVSRERLALAVAEGSDAVGPYLGVRKWRVLAGLCVGLACAVKWDALWYLIGFFFLALAWDGGARRAAGLRNYWQGALLRDGRWLLVTLGAIPFATYLTSWAGWFLTRTGWDRNYAQLRGVHVPVISALYSLFEYHKEIWAFDSHLHAYHPYRSQPWDWIVIARPIAYYYQCYVNAAGTAACPKGTVGYSQEVLAMGNPLIWWVSIPAMLFCLGWWLTRRDWRAGAALFGVAVGWLPWFPFVSRTKFYYYALDFLPFMIICIVLCLGLIIGPARAGARRAAGVAVAGIYLLAVLLMFGYFYPIWAGGIIPYSSWLSHMWFNSWI